VIDGDRELGERAARELRKSATVLVRAERGGLSAARNTALDQVATPLVAFLDDDAVADEHWLASLRRQLRRDVLGVGGRSVPAWEHGRRPDWFPQELLWTVGCSYRGLPESAAVVRNVFGGCALYRTSLFDEIGGFRTDLGRQANGAAGCEETELCLRAAAAHPGGVFVYTPEAVIHHYVSSQRATPRYVLRRSLYEGRSKARLSEVTPACAGSLRTERSYLRSTLAPAVAGGCRDGFRGDWDGLGRAGLLGASVVSAGVGFATQRTRDLARGLVGRSAVHAGDAPVTRSRRRSGSPPSRSIATGVRSR
jgi:cellulose synthase/poly-beta-1,6-N-acetylglucosamine synthase-like glycosyltransferase